MDSLRKHISSRNPHQFIILRTQHLQISRQSSTVTAHINNPLRFHLKDRIQKYLIAALSRRVHNDDICVDAILLILPRQYFFRFSNKNSTFSIPLSFAFSLALSIACGTISTPRTNFAFWARNREMVPIPQYRSQTVSSPVRPAYSRAFPYSFRSGWD